MRYTSHLKGSKYTEYNSTYGDETYVYQHSATGHTNNSSYGL